MNAPAATKGGITPCVQSLFAVPGLRCAGCISKLESGLPQIAGIVAARVNLTAKRVRIDHLPDMDVPALKAAFGSLGFDAEPITSIVSEERGRESGALLKSMAVAGFAAMNIMLLSVSVWSGAEGSTRDLFHWLSACIALPTVAYAGRPFFASALAALRRKRTNMDVPISIGVLLATGISLYETIVGGPHAWFDGAVMLLFFLLAGRWLDSVMRDRARDGVAALLRQTAPGALVKTGQGTRWTSAADIEPGMEMLVAAGERLAADGVIAEGTSAFDLSLLTGESAPQLVAKGDRVHAGTLNLDGPVTVRVTAAREDTVIADIARLMEEAGQSKSRYVRIADRAARLYAPAVHLLAALSFAGWMLAGAGWHQALLIAAAVLIITCPCALGLAVPAAQIVASGVLMRRGVLIKDGSALERLSEANQVIFDKTGTLTLGRPEPANLHAFSAEDKAIILALASASRHPLSNALRTALEREGVAAAPVTGISEEPGLGVSGAFDGEVVALSRPVNAMLHDNLATSYVRGIRPPRPLLFNDAIRPEAAQTVRQLQGMGLPGLIASGDRVAALYPIAAMTGLTAQGGMHPQDKLELVRRLSAGGAKILMVGDGLNDGPALAAGHVSMAPASASDASQNAADAVFLGDSLAPVATAVKVARRTMAVVRQNFALAIGYNVIAVPLAIMGYATPLMAALAMSGSSLIVVANALRLRGAAQ
jgi:Cu2+-exporting ATPase